MRPRRGAEGRRCPPHHNTPDTIKRHVPVEGPWVHHLRALPAGVPVRPGAERLPCLPCSPRSAAAAPAPDDDGGDGGVVDERRRRRPSARPHRSITPAAWVDAAVPACQIVCRKESSGDIGKKRESKACGDRKRQSAVRDPAAADGCIITLADAMPIWGGIEGQGPMAGPGGVSRTRAAPAQHGSTVSVPVHFIGSLPFSLSNPS